MKNSHPLHSLPCPSHSIYSTNMLIEDKDLSLFYHYWKPPHTCDTPHFPSSILSISFLIRLIFNVYIIIICNAITGKPCSMLSFSFLLIQLVTRINTGLITFLSFYASSTHLSPNSPSCSSPLLLLKHIKSLSIP